MKQEPIRTCLTCGKKRTKKGLLRLVMEENGFRFDREKLMKGRGFYICIEEQCVSGFARGKGAVRKYRPSDGSAERLLDEMISEVRS